MAAVRPASAEWVSGGYLKSYLLWQDSTALAGPSQWQSQNSLRLMASHFWENGGNVEVHYEYQPVYSTEPGFASGAGISSTLGVTNNRYRYKDITNDLGDEDSHWIQLHNLDRLNYRYSSASGDLTLGRQVVSFGSARFVNPTDIFLPYNLQTLNQEYRVGIDAARYQWALGDFRLLDLGVVIGEDGAKQNNALFLRARDNLNGSDLELVLIVQQQSYLIGGGVETALGDFGFWFETAYVNSDGLTDTNAEANSVTYWRHSMGADYALRDDLIAMVEYHYNGAGSHSAQGYVSLLQLQPYAKGGVYLLGQHYLIPALSWEFSPLINLTASAFFNLSDQSQFLTLAADISWSENLYSDVGVYLSQGDSLQGDINDPANLVLGSEFGEYPVTLYASLRFYF